jgi:hypothetical protein
MKIQWLMMGVAVGTLPLGHPVQRPEILPLPEGPKADGGSEIIASGGSPLCQQRLSRRMRALHCCRLRAL